MPILETWWWNHRGGVGPLVQNTWLYSAGYFNLHPLSVPPTPNENQQKPWGSRMAPTVMKTWAGAVVLLRIPPWLTFSAGQSVRHLLILLPTEPVFVCLIFCFPVCLIGDISAFKKKTKHKNKKLSSQDPVKMKWQIPPENTWRQIPGQWHGLRPGADPLGTVNVTSKTSKAVEKLRRLI